MSIYANTLQGYQNWSQTEEVVENFNKFGMPLETIWNDIDWMNAYRNFDNDPIRFSYDEGAAFLERLHMQNKHYVPIIDAAIYHPNPANSSDIYPVFDDGNDHEVFLLNPDGSLYIGQVWPGYTVYPDWMSEDARSWWIRSVQHWRAKNITFDGLWIDMNEAASFCVGSCGSDKLDQNPAPFSIDSPSSKSSISSQSISTSAAEALSTTTSEYFRTTPTPNIRNVNHPPYAINHARGDLAGHAVSPNATHHNGYQEYDVHNLYGHQLLENTYAALKTTMPDRRPFIIGRSTFAGSGRFAGHWGGDNYSRWQSMIFSIPQALSFSLFGMPMFGVDACGFGGDTTEELCNRWMQLAAFFPFYRNHAAINSISQEPYRWGSVLEATKVAMTVRFSLLPYMYTLMHYAHSRGDTVMRALAWEFPDDPLLANADRQFFLGPAILVTPVLNEGYTTVDGVFPGLSDGKEVYYDWYNQTVIRSSSKKNITIDAPLGHIPVYIRGGHILATQEMRLSTAEARKTDWSLIVALDNRGRANGTLYLDDGYSIEPVSKIVTLAAQVGMALIDGKNRTEIRIDVFNDGAYNDLDLPLGKITVLGLQAPPANKEIIVGESGISGSHWNYCDTEKRLIMSDMQNMLGGKIWSRRWSLRL